MVKRSVLALVLAVVLTTHFIVGVAVVAADPAVPTPTETGCPAGYELMAVEDLEAQGPYRVPRMLDESGNNNGLICALALPEAFRLQFCGPECPVPVVYLFRDDDLPAQQ